MQIVTKKVSKVPTKEEKIEKVAEVVKDVAPAVASAVIAAAPLDKKREAKKWTSIGLSALAIILHIVEHLA